MKVYRYWAQPMSAQDNFLLMDQLAKAAAYRRRLTDIENRCRVLVRALIASGMSEAEQDQLRVQIVNAQRSAVKAARDQARSPTHMGTPVYSGVGSGRRLIDPRDLPGAAWGTCGQVDDSVDMARRTTKFSSDLRTHVPRDEGILAVQYQQHKSDPRWRPVMADELVGGDDSFVHLGDELIAKAKRPDQRPGAKRLTHLKFRIGSNGRSPIWANLYTLLHRPLPHARVTWIKLSCERVGLRYNWALIVVVDEECRGRPDDERADGVGVDIGWRMVPSGIRIAVWHGTDGRHGELVIPEETYRRKGKSDSLRSIRDRERNEVAQALRKWIFGEDDQPGLPVDHPVRVAAHSMHQWLRVGRYVHLTHVWQSNRLPGDGMMWEYVQKWLQHDRHLYAWEVNNRRRMALSVRARVEELAVRLARQYRMLAVECRGMVPALVKASGSDDEWLRALNATRTGMVAPASVRKMLEQYALKYGALYREEDPADTTRDCDACGVRREIEDQSQLFLTCPSCGTTSDQDMTAARNILRRATARVAQEAAEALEPVSSSGKRKKLAARRNRRRQIDKPLETADATCGRVS